MLLVIRQSSGCRDSIRLSSEGRHLDVVRLRVIGNQQSTTRRRRYNQLPMASSFSFSVLLSPIIVSMIVVLLVSFIQQQVYSYSFSSTLGCRYINNNKHYQQRDYHRLVRIDRTSTNAKKKKLHTNHRSLLFSSSAVKMTFSNEEQQQPQQFDNSTTITTNASPSRSSIAPLPTAETKQFQKIGTFVDKNFFTIGMILTILLANMVPPGRFLGSKMNRLSYMGVRAERLIHQYGIFLVFLITGTSIDSKQLRTATITNWKLNVWIQFITFVLWPICIGYPLCQIMALMFQSTTLASLIPRPLIDGLYITTCLPTTINACIVLTRSASGTVATAICNSMTSNMLGIFVTPFLILFGSTVLLHDKTSISLTANSGNSGSISTMVTLLELISRLCFKVLVPIGIGQWFRKIPFLYSFCAKQSTLLKRIQDIVLLSILWNSFTKVTSVTTTTMTHSAIIMIGALTTLHCTVLLLSYQWFHTVLQYNRSDSIAAMFCSSHKTLAFGIPLINTLFASVPESALVASYCLPIMFLHPIQLLIGSILASIFESSRNVDPINQAAKS